MIAIKIIYIQESHESMLKSANYKNYGSTLKR